MAIGSTDLLSSHALFEQNRTAPVKRSWEVSNMRLISLGRSIEVDDDDVEVIDGRRM